MVEQDYHLNYGMQRQFLCPIVSSNLSLWRLILNLAQSLVQLFFTPDRCEEAVSRLQNIEVCTGVFKNAG